MAERQQRGDVHPHRGRDVLHRRELRPRRLRRQRHRHLRGLRRGGAVAAPRLPQRRPPVRQRNGPHRPPRAERGARRHPGARLHGPRFLLSGRFRLALCAARGGVRGAAGLPAAAERAGRLHRGAGAFPVAGKTTLTPRAWLSRSGVSVDPFTDSVGLESRLSLLKLKPSDSIRVMTNLHIQSIS